MKCIQVLHHSATASHVELWGLFFNGWHARVGKEIAKRVHMDVECVMSDPLLRDNFTVDTDGVRFKGFRSYFIRSGLEFSPSLLNYLRKSTREQNVVLHLHGDQSLSSYFINSQFGSKPMVIQHHGTTGSPYFIPFDKMAFRGRKLFFVLSDLKRKYLINRVGICPDRIKIQTMGTDTDVFHPISPAVCKALIGVPENKAYVLFVGDFKSFKGLPLVVRAVESLKKRFDVELLAVGGTKNDPLYSWLQRKTKYVYETVKYANMPLFHNACSCFAWYWSRPNWGGPGVSMMETMACNKAVVSNTLTSGQIPADLSEKAGALTLVNSDMFERTIERALLLNSRVHTRDLAVKYFGWDSIIKGTIESYRKILGESA